MKQIILFAISVLGLFSPVHAQEPAVKWGEPVSKAPETKDYALYQTGEPGFYFFREMSVIGIKQYRLDKYNDSYKELYSKTIPLTEVAVATGDGIFFEKVLPVKNRMIAFYSGYKKATKESYFLVRNILANGDVEKTDIKLESITAESRLNSGAFFVTVSPDKSKLLLVTSLPFAKDKKAQLRVKAFETEKLNEIWSKNVELGYESKKGSIISYLIDNTGNAYITGRYNPGKKYDYLLWTYSMADSQWKENVIDLKGKNISDEEQRLIVDATGNIVFSGFLFENGKENFNGIFYVRVSGQTQTVEAVAQTGYGDLAQKEKESPAFTRWKLRGVLSQSNGNILVIGEDEYGTSTEINSQGGIGSTAMSYIYKHNSGTIKVLSILPDGTKNWITSIPKRQKYTTTEPVSRINSFVYTLVNDHLCILYNCLDLAQTLTIPAWSWKENGVSYNIKNFVMKTEYPTFLQIVEPNGKLSYGSRKFGFPLFNFQDGIYYPMTLNTFVFIPLPDGIIMMDESKERYQFGKISF